MNSIEQTNAMPMAKASEPVRGMRVQATLQQLRELIVNGRLAPGSRIVEADLAQRLGVSRTPVRDALHCLRQEGFIVARAGGGPKVRLVVAPLTKEDARELYWIVGHLEGLAARLTVQLEPSTRNALVQDLRRLNEGLEGVAQAGRQDPNRIFELDMTFHRKIVEARSGPRLLALHNSIKPQTERYWRLYAGAIIDRLAASVGEHLDIIKAIENSDSDAAERTVRLNWENGAERLCSVIDSLGERGSWQLNTYQGPGSS